LADLTTLLLGRGRFGDFPWGPPKVRFLKVAKMSKTVIPAQRGFQFVYAEVEDGAPFIISEPVIAWVVDLSAGKHDITPVTPSGMDDGRFIVYPDCSVFDVISETWFESLNAAISDLQSSVRCEAETEPSAAEELA